FEDGVSGLDGGYAAREEVPSFADAFDGVVDRFDGLTGAQEVGVEAVDRAEIDGAARRHDRLGEHEATEETAFALAGLATEVVVVAFCEVEVLEQGGNSRLALSG